MWGGSERCYVHSTILKFELFWDNGTVLKFMSCSWYSKMGLFFLGCSDLILYLLFEIVPWIIANEPYIFFILDNSFLLCIFNCWAKKFVIHYGAVLVLYTKPHSPLTWGGSTLYTQTFPSLWDVFQHGPHKSSPCWPALMVKHALNVIRTEIELLLLT